MTRSTLTLAIALWFACAFARADAPDLSSPKAAAKSLYEAVDRADGEAIRTVFFSETDAQRKLADAYAEMILATKRLADAAESKYAGAAAADADALALGAVPAEDVKRIDAADVKHDAPDRATLTMPLATRPMTFRKTERGWQLVISDFAGGAPDRVDAQIEMTRQITAVVTEVAEGIESDKYPTPHDAEQAIQQRMNEVMTRAVRKNLPATAPATQPMTSPFR
jgi:hypothetical protein